MDEISDDEKREQMNRLYIAAKAMRLAQLKFCDGANAESIRELMACGDRLGMILTEINGGKSPILFMSRAANICETAALIAGG